MEYFSFKQVVIKILKVFFMLVAIIAIIVNWTPNVINETLNSLALLGLNSKVGITVAMKDSDLAIISGSILAILIGVLILTKKRTNLDYYTIFWIVIVFIVVEQVLIATML